MDAAVNTSASATRLTLHEGRPPPPSFLLARDVAWAITTASLVFFAVAFVVVGERFAELRHHVQRDGKKAGRAGFQKKVVLWMLVMVGFNVAQQAENSVMFGVDAAARSTTYCQFSHKHGAFTYGGAMLGNYMVLVIRARTTSASASKAHRVLQRATELLTMAGVPGIMLVSLFLFRGRVLFDSVCAQELPIVIVYVFMVADLNLSLMLLALFVLPVMNHISSSTALGRSTSGKMEQDLLKMRRLAVKNMKLSAVQVVSTFVVQLAGAITQTILNDEHNPELSYWRWVRFSLYSVDLLLNTVTLMMMSNAWVPESWPRLRAFLNRFLDDDKQGGGGGQRNTARPNTHATAPASNAVASSVTTSRLCDD